MFDIFRFPQLVRSFSGISLQTKGGKVSRPAPWAGHAFAVAGGQLVVHGGRDDSGGLCGDAWALRRAPGALQALSWARLPDGPSARCGHWAVATGVFI